MERAEFARRLAEATTRTLALTRSRVLEAIPEAAIFAPRMQPWEGLVPLPPGHVIFADDHGRFPDAPRRRCTPADMVDLLWRDGRVPLWIDVVVVAVEGDHAVIEAEVSPRFTDDPAIFSGAHAEERPFVIKAIGSPPWIPLTPQRWPLERFPLRWRDDPEAARRAHEAGGEPRDAGTPDRDEGSCSRERDSPAATRDRGDSP